MSFLADLLAAVVRASLGALADYLKQRRAEETLVQKGRLEQFKEEVESNVRVSREVREVRHRLRTDPEYRERMLAQFRSSARPQD